MVLEEKIEINKIEIIKNTIYLQQKITILKDNVEIAKKFHRISIKQGDDLTNFDQQIQKIANAIWL